MAEYRPMWHGGSMELSAALFQRRTIKDFRPEGVPPDLLERALTAGLWAQNHKLTEPWRFTLLGPQTQRQLAMAFAEAQAASFTSEADIALREVVRSEAANKILAKPNVVAVSQHLAGNSSQQREDYAAIACAIQNIQLAAWAEGVGMQWSSGKIIQLPETYAALGINREQEEIAGLLFFGYPANVPPAPPRQPLAAVARYLP